MILCLETATPTCSVALSDGEKTLALRECQGKNAHSEKITLFIKEVMDKVGIGYHQLDAVAVSKGPGSYTGLRIGVSTAKGICYAADLPLMAIDTLQAMAYGMRDRLGAELQPGDLLVPMIDARRMEVYCAVFDAEMNRIQDTQAMVFETENEERKTESRAFSVFRSPFSVSRMWLFGDGAPKLHQLFEGDDLVRIVDGFTPSAAYMAALAHQALKEGDFVDVAYFEPFYLKDFVAGKPHVKGL